MRVRGNSIFPPTILNRFHILLAILRQLHLVFAIALFSDELYSLRPDVFIVDQLSACVPLLRWLFPKKARTLFYCHFPDQLLVLQEQNAALKSVKKAYRYPFDWFEGWSMNASDRIVVNSKFTKSVARKVFPTIERDLGVIYPCVDTDEPTPPAKDEPPLWNNDYKIVLSINRYERKKDVALAIQAYKKLSEKARRGTRLICAGGYDERVVENKEYHEELVALAEEAGLKTATARTVPTALAVPADVEVLFLLSVPDAFKTTLLKNARLLLYTPKNEHFGIVPVEAMKFGVPVLASNTGGPLETVVEGQTGWLRDVQAAQEWADVIERVLQKMTTKQLQDMSGKARQRVKDNFTRPKMAETFDTEITHMVDNERSPFVERESVMLAMGVGGAFIAALFAVIMRSLFRLDPRASEFSKVKREASPSSNFKMPVVRG